MLYHNAYEQLKIAMATLRLAFPIFFFNVIRNTGLKQIIASSPLLLQYSSYTVALMK